MIESLFVSDFKWLYSKIEDTIEKKVDGLEFSTTKNLKTVSDKVDEIDSIYTSYAHGVFGNPITRSQFFNGEIQIV